MFELRDTSKCFSQMNVYLFNNNIISKPGLSGIAN